MGSEKMEKVGKPERRYDLDWLRIVAMLAVFFYHCARFFGPEGWHLKNAVQSETVFVLRVALIWVWVMELFFLLSGVGTWYALKSRTGRQYLIERSKRLLIPLYSVGLFIIIPPQVFFELFTNKGYTGTFLELLPNYYRSLPSDLFLQHNLHNPSFLVPYGFAGHLWFLRYLFLISLVTLPLLLYLKSEPGQRGIERLAGWYTRSGGIFLFVIPLSLTLICLRSLFIGNFTWADFIWYAIYFVIGFIMAADVRFTESIKRHGLVGLGLWIAGFSGVGFFVTQLGYNPMPGNEPFSLIYVLYQIAWTVTSWGAVVFILSLGAKYLTFNNKILAYGNETVLPFYIFHQTIILSVGWFVIRWNIGILPKYMIIAVVSFCLIMVLYELFVRRINIVRFFFGMRPRKTR
jgi:peptidoglycan/LPS O-acetylase OafA/YrhL